MDLLEHFMKRIRIIKLTKHEIFIPTIQTHKTENRNMESEKGFSQEEKRTSENAEKSRKQNNPSFEIIY